MSKAILRRGSAAAAAGLALFAGAAGAQDAAKDVVQQWNAVKAEAPPELTPVTIDVKKTGVVVMDFNQANCPARPRCAAAIPKVQKLIASVRAKGVTIVFVRNTAMKPEDFVKDVAPKPGEPYIEAAKEDKFFGNDLEKILKDKGVDTVILVGTQANGSILASAFGAAFRGFKVIVPVDTMPAATAYQEQFTIWEIANGNTFRGVSTLTRSDMIKF